MGLSDPSTCRRQYHPVYAFSFTYEECAGDKDENTVLAGRLGIESVGAVLDLLEGQVLRESA
jgi:hypothetical protein